MKKQYLLLITLLSTSMLFGCGSENESVVIPETTPQADVQQNDVQPAVSVQQYQMPDPLPYLSQGSGGLVQQGYQANGVTYNVYDYSFSKQASTSIAVGLWGYSAVVKNAGYQWSYLSDMSGAEEEWYEISSSGGAALFVCSGSYSSTSCTARLFLPENFVLYEVQQEEKTTLPGKFQNDPYF